MDEAFCPWRVLMPLPLRMPLRQPSSARSENVEHSDANACDCSRAIAKVDPQTAVAALQVIWVTASTSVFDRQWACSALAGYVNAQ